MDEKALWVLLAGLAFAVPHLLLGFPPLRPRLAAALGEQRFVALFALLAAAGLAALAVALARSDGAGPGFGAALPTLARWALLVIAVAGLVLAFAALGAYPRNPAALFRQRVAPPRGIEKLSRHGFFVGFGTFAFAQRGFGTQSADSGPRKSTVVKGAEGRRLGVQNLTSPGVQNLTCRARGGGNRTMKRVRVPPGVRLAQVARAGKCTGQSVGPGSAP